MPPIEVKSIKKKVNDKNAIVYTNKVAVTNNTNAVNITDEDDNGNRASVADLCKKFDYKPHTITKNGTNNLLLLKAFKTKSPKITENCEISASITTKFVNSKKVNNCVNKKSNSCVSATSITGKKTDSLTSIKCLSNVDVLQSKFEVNNKGDVVENGTDIDREDVGLNSNNEDTDLETQKSNARVNSFASYISTKDFEKVDDKVNGSNSIETNKNDMDNKDNSYLGKILAQNVSKVFVLFIQKRICAAEMSNHKLKNLYSKIDFKGNV